MFKTLHIFTRKRFSNVKYHK